MRNDLLTRRATLVAAVLFTVTLLLLLPAMAVLSFESARVDAAGSEPDHDTTPTPFIVSRVAPVETELAEAAAATPAVPSRPLVGRGEATEHAAQSAAMVLAGSLLIAVGSIVRKAVAS